MSKIRERAIGSAVTVAVAGGVLWGVMAANAGEPDPQPTTEPTPTVTETPEPTTEPEPTVTPTPTVTPEPEPTVEAPPPAPEPEEPVVPKPTSQPQTDDPIYREMEGGVVDLSGGAPGEASTG